MKDNFNCVLVALLMAFVALFVSVLCDSEPIIVKGSYFFYENGTQFSVRGLHYTMSTGTATGPGVSDMLQDGRTCARDIPYFQELGVNLIRVYGIDSTVNHSNCMQQLQDAGIYVLADLSSIDAANYISVEGNPRWDVDFYTSFSDTIDEMSKYTNVLGFVIIQGLNDTTTNLLPQVKAAVRDMKAYILEKSYRKIPIGYLHGHDLYHFADVADYLSCGDGNQRVDFLGFFGPSFYTFYNKTGEQGFQNATRDLEHLNIPIIIYDWGSVTIPNTYPEVRALYDSKNSVVWSGGILYQYIEQVWAYGLVNVNGLLVQALDTFSSASSLLADYTPTLTDAKDYTPTATTTPGCPTLAESGSVTTSLPPTPHRRLCDCMAESLSCVARRGLTNVEASQAYGNLTGSICSTDADLCAGVVSNGTTGEYGTFSNCNKTHIISWIYNQYYLSQNNNSAACDFNGTATMHTPRSLGSDCPVLLAQAGHAGTGSITTTPPAPTGTAVVASTADNYSNSSDSNTKVGIGIGVSLGVVALLICALLVLREVKQKRKQASRQSNEHEARGYQKPELDAIETRREELADTTKSLPLQMSATEPMELGDGSEMRCVSEMPNTQVPVEMPDAQVRGQDAE
ncbi:beta-1,3-glucanosyltransferase [Macrophomina phaseolina]|uniref:1,3-beta-glucanosyltransferase n=1 Tax=Macrophomina phaseolina TaxID=35725 RepID=A0ABQ8FVF0_9PEZI|nr:beta-1,3-glucanosyltransferase [Macrophomina phaseolina]